MVKPQRIKLSFHIYLYSTLFYSLFVSIFCSVLPSTNSCLWKCLWKADKGSVNGIKFFNTVRHRVFLLSICLLFAPHYFGPILNVRKAALATVSCQGVTSSGTVPLGTWLEQTLCSSPDFDGRALTVQPREGRRDQSTS